jgi:hypothetical protein
MSTRTRPAPIALLLAALLVGGCQKYAAAEVRRGLDGPPAGQAGRDAGRAPGPAVRAAGFIDTNYLEKESRPMSTTKQSRPANAKNESRTTSTKNDFDFLVGDWQAVNRRLKVRHKGGNDWDEFPGFSTMRTILGGLGNVDEVAFPTKGWSGATFRLFNVATRQWSIWWVNNREGVMLPPVVGSFSNGIGEFHGEDLDDGVPVRVRFIWSRITPRSARWEQAFSWDGGKTWETNWTMDF